MQFIVTGKDGTDAEAPARRQNARQAHLENVAKLKAAGNLLFAAALCDEAEGMTGSLMVFDFATRAMLDEYLQNEAYITGGVWQRVEIAPCKVPDLFLA